MTDTITMNSKGAHVCPHQIGFMLDNPFRRLIQNPRKIVGEYIREGDTIIDMGCGPGYFTIDMAKMAGERGKVIAVDLQGHMLLKIRKKARKHGVMERIEFHQCGEEAIGLDKKADFILAYYMIHETPNPKGFLDEVKKNLKDDGKMLIVEPRMHVSKNLFETMLKEAGDVGLKIIDLPKGKGGRSVLFMRG